MKVKYKKDNIWNEDIIKMNYGHYAYISPKTYLNLAKKRTNPDLSSITFFKKQIKNNKKISVPFLEINEKKVIGHEGRHRAMAIHDLGIKRMKVLIMDTKNDRGTHRKTTIKKLIPERMF